MTIPIIPGPFSFLEGAGKAVGAVGREVEAQRQQRIAEAQNRLANALTLIQLGTPPTAFEQEDLARTLDTLGLGPTDTEAVFRGAAERARVALQRAGGEARGAVAGAQLQEARVPTAPRLAEAETRRAEAGATLEGARAERAEPLAEAETRRATATADVAAEAARGAPAATNEQIAQSQARERLFKGAFETLGNNEDFRELAEAAAFGILPFYLEQYRVRFGGLPERIRVLSNAMTDIRALTLQREREWNDGLQAFIRDAVVGGQAADTPEAQQALYNEYTKRAGPPPTFERVRDEYARSQFGITGEQLSGALREAAPQMTGILPGAAAAQPLPTAAQQRIRSSPEFQAERARQRAARGGGAPLQAPTQTSDERVRFAVERITTVDLSAEEWIRALEGKGFTDDEYAALLEQLRPLAEQNVTLKPLVEALAQKVLLPERGQPTGPKRERF